MKALQIGAYALGILLAFFCQAAALAESNILDGPTLPSFRFPLGEATARTFDGGWAKEATVKNFPVSQNIAGVAMALKPGALRELHWHANAAEWAYVISGHCQITVIDFENRVEKADMGPGDVWYFPRGHGHSIQGIGTEECKFILVFDNGSFSDFATFSISDWLAHTPPEVLAKNFKVSSSVFKDFPKKEVYITQGPVPAAVPADLPPFTQIAAPLTHKYSLGAQRGDVWAGGRFQLVSQKQFPISTTMTGALQTLNTGGSMREMHWHPNADEWQYYISGHARMTVFGSNGRSRLEEFGPGDVGYVPQGYGHYIENASDTEPCVTLIVLNSGNYQEISLSQWMASNTAELLGTNFKVPKKIFESFPQNNSLIAPGNNK
jgi:oxalate decarboxylase